jgi:Ca-activated chloride channel family protein
LEESNMVSKISALAALAAAWVVVCARVPEARAAGVLRPANAGDAPIEILDHAVRVVTNNGFSRVEVRQTFHNPNPTATDAVYEFPVPPDAALSEMTIELDDRTLRGEVVDEARAQSIYEEETNQGNQAGLAEQNGYQNFVFSVGQIPPHSDATMSFVYYETASVDANVGRFLYPLEYGGTDDGRGFWTGETTSTGNFSFDLELKSAAPITDVRIPGVAGVDVRELGPNHFQLHFDAAPGTLTEDVVAYYRLEERPCGIELVPYRAAGAASGTFMLLVTPGIELAPLEGEGTDFTFVLDYSGSMETKIATLREAIARVLAELGPRDRFRLVVFSDAAHELTPGFLATTPENVALGTSVVNEWAINGGTNLYAGLTLGLTEADPERVASIFLVTDAVTNTGVIAPLEFDALMRESDQRVFGFLMGNSANWPLMEILTEASGGFYAPVSNRDDVLGQVLLAKNKLTHESLHDARLVLDGVDVSDTTDFDVGKVYRGQQLVVFGRYANGGSARLGVNARVRNQARSYAATVTFPEIAEESAEIERLWALEMIHAIERHAMLGMLDATEAAERVRRLGIEYQLVTDQTSMIVLDDAGFEEHGVARRNRDRTAIEDGAGTGTGTGAGTGTGTGTGTPGSSNGTSGGGDGGYGGSSGGGALDPMSVAILAMALAALGGARARRRGAA